MRFIFNFLLIKEFWINCLHKKILGSIIFSTWAPNLYFRMISEGSCDIEDWSNDAEIQQTL